MENYGSRQIIVLYMFKASIILYIYTHAIPLFQETSITFEFFICTKTLFVKCLL